MRFYNKYDIILVQYILEANVEPHVRDVLDVPPPDLQVEMAVVVVVVVVVIAVPVPFLAALRIVTSRLSWSWEILGPMCVECCHLAAECSWRDARAAMSQNFVRMSQWAWPANR